MMNFINIYAKRTGPTFEIRFSFSLIIEMLLGKTYHSSLRIGGLIISPCSRRMSLLPMMWMTLAKSGKPWAVLVQ